MAIGVLLINVGSPRSPEIPEVREYLREFLMDPDVIDLPLPARWLLVNGIILRKRPAASSEAYRKIWTGRGSPLVFHTRDLAEKVGRALGGGFLVRFGMRYGEPSIASALGKLVEAGAKRVIAFPLYPQYSQAATQSAVKALELAAGRLRASRTDLAVIPEFYDHPAFLDAFAETGREFFRDRGSFDFTLFSFHGLPERHIRRLDPSGKHCLVAQDCCARIVEQCRRCYRAQCHETARGIARRLGLAPERWAVSFQSRLERQKWIEPYTDHFFDELPRQGVRRLAVFCPAFVADCLETLEEIEMRGREQFRAAGGEELALIPSLNSRDFWVSSVCQIVRETVS